MKRIFRLGIAATALFLCGGTFGLASKFTNNKVHPVYAAKEYIAHDGSGGKYASYDELVSALETKNNEMFTVERNFTISDTIDLSGRNATIDLGGFTVTVSATTLFNLTSSSNLIISNGRLLASDSSTNEFFNLTGASLTATDILMNLSVNTASHFAINAESGSNVIRLSNCGVLRGYHGVKLAGSSFLYVSGNSEFGYQNSSGFPIFNGSALSSVYLSGSSTISKISTYSTIYFFDGNLENPTYFTPTSDITLTLNNVLINNGTTVVNGALSSATNSVRFSNLSGTGYASTTVASGTLDNAYDIVLSYYSCTPTITGNHFSIVSQTSPATYSPSGSYNCSYEFEADYGFYFSTQKSAYNVTITINGSQLETSQYNYGYTIPTLGVPYYTHCTISFSRTLVVGPVTITVNPGESNYLTTARTFIADYMHMDDYDPGLTGDGNGSCTSYFSAAFQAFNNLTNFPRQVFFLTNDENVAAARERLLTWADINGYKMSDDYKIIVKTNILPPAEANNVTYYPVIILVSFVSVVSLSGMIIFLKKKHK